MNKWKGFEWTEECALAFQQLKEYLSRPPIMSSPLTDEVLFFYIAVAPHAMSLVLIRIDNGIQQPIYHVSKSLHEAEIRYLPLEKAILAIVHGTRKLLHYFQAHTIVILTQLPLRTILRSSDYTGRISKWGPILRAFDIKYMSRTSVKGQVLANLVAEFAEPALEEMSTTQNIGGKSVGTISLREPPVCKVYVDGMDNQRGSGVGLVLISPEKLTIEKSLRPGFSATNNEAEYETLLARVSIVQRMGGKAIKVFSDSRLVVGQVGGELEARDERMQGYLNQVRFLHSKFESFSLHHILRSGNTHADSLAMLASSLAQSLPWVILVEDLCKPIEIKGVTTHVQQIGVGSSWMYPIISFLKEDTLPSDKLEVEKIWRKSPQFWLSEDQKLYTHSFSGPYLLCIHPETLDLLLEELHKGIAEVTRRKIFIS